MKKSNKCIVEDFIPEKADEIKYIFVLESPHNNEIVKGLPLSGKSGEHIMKVLGFEDYQQAFGVFVENRHDTAIINISNEPLQELKNENRENDLIKIYSFIRKNYKSLLNHRDETINLLEKNFIYNFKKRFDSFIKTKNFTIILCGKFAKKYFEKTYPEQLFEAKIYFMPHPSYNRWLKLNEEQKEILLELKKY